MQQVLKLVDPEAFERANLNRQIDRAAVDVFQGGRGAAELAALISQRARNIVSHKVYVARRTVERESSLSPRAPVQRGQ